MTTNLVTILATEDLISRGAISLDGSISETRLAARDGLRTKLAWPLGGADLGEDTILMGNVASPDHIQSLYLQQHKAPITAPSDHTIQSLGVPFGTAGPLVAIIPSRPSQQQQQHPQSVENTTLPLIPQLTPAILPSVNAVLESLLIRYNDQEAARMKALQEWNEKQLGWEKQVRGLEQALGTLRQEIWEKNEEYDGKRQTNHWAIQQLEENRQADHRAIQQLEEKRQTDHRAIQQLEEKLRVSELELQGAIMEGHHDVADITEHLTINVCRPYFHPQHFCTKNSVGRTMPKEH